MDSNNNKQMMKKVSIYLVLLTLILASCGPSAEQLEQQVENNLRQLSELGTVEYVVTKIVKANDNATWYKFGDRKIIFTCKANLKAGIDLSELPKDSIRVDADQKSISLVLPKAKLLSCNMKPDDIHLVYEKTAITRFSYSNADRDDVMTQGEKNIKESVAELGILTDAENNAKIFLEAFLKQAGYDQIEIKFHKTDKN
jgi:hypothetical protein